MIQESLSFLVSPCCRSAFSLTVVKSVAVGNQLDIVAGNLKCACSKDYPIIRGVPVLIRPADPSSSDARFGGNLKTWNEIWEKTKAMGDNFFTTGDMFFYEFRTDKSVFRDSAVLEVGVGQGKYMQYITNAAPRWFFGIDISDCLYELWENNREKLLKRNVCLVKADVRALPFRNNTFDWVVSARVLHHIPPISQRMRELNDLLNSGGKMFVSVYAWDGKTRRVILGIEKLKTILNRFLGIRWMYWLSFLPSLFIHLTGRFVYRPLHRFGCLYRFLPLSELMQYWAKLPLMVLWKFIIFDILIAPETQYTSEFELKEILAAMPVRRWNYYRQHSFMWTAKTEK